MSWTLSQSGSAFAKAGDGMNEVFEMSGSFMAKLDEFSDEAEGTLNARTRKDWVADYASVKTNFKPILAETCSAMIAMKIINYDMSGYTSRLEAQTMLDVLRDTVNTNIKALENDNVKENME